MVSFPALWPFLNFLNINRDENYSIAQLALYGLVTLILASIGFIAFRLILRRSKSSPKADETSNAISAATTSARFIFCPSNLRLTHGPGGAALATKSTTASLNKYTVVGAERLTAAVRVVASIPERWS